MIGWLPRRLRSSGTVPASPLISLASAVLHVPAPERALVVGCGDGEAVLLLAREFPAARVRGLDPSPELIREDGLSVAAHHVRYVGDPGRMSTITSNTAPRTQRTILTSSCGATW